MTMESELRTTGGASRVDLSARADVAHSQRSDVSDQSLGELVSNLSQTTTRLLRQEVALARSETRTEVRAAGRGVGTLAVAGGVALVALVLFSLGAARGLSEYMDLGWAYVLVGAIWVIVAGLLYAAGRETLKDVTPVAERTQESLREIPDAVRGR
jgi:hypothetical protein